MLTMLMVLKLLVFENKEAKKSDENSNILLYLKYALK